MGAVESDLNSYYAYMEAIPEDYNSDRYMELKMQWDLLEDSITGLIAWYEKVKYIQSKEIKEDFETDRASYIKEQQAIEVLMQEEKDNY